MAQLLLSQALSEKISVEKILHWIKSTEANQNNDSTFSCTPGEFISHLLNFIHEEALCFEKYRVTPKKVHTPKSIRKLEITTKPRRRPPLFSDTPSPRARNQNQHDSRTEKVCPLSPVSPLYTRLNMGPIDSPLVTTPKARNLCLGDFISPNCRSTGNGNKKKEMNSMSTQNTGSLGRSLAILNSTDNDPRGTRRINPTHVTQHKTLNTKNSFDFKSDALENTKDEMKLSITLTPKSASSTVILPKPPQREIPPDLTNVTQSGQMNILITLYIDLINNHRVLNMTSELYFITTLLLSKQYELDYFPSPIFASIHNVVYFALNSLHKLINTKSNAMRLLDKASLRLLASNERVKTLDGELIKMFLNLSEKVECTGELSMPTPEKLEKNVCFDLDTDNRDNFPTDASFHAFRKQRDMFYEILSAWEANHTVDGWNFSAGLGNKVKTLLGMHSDPANFRHLSRLVKSQLIMTCTKVQDESLPENQLTFLTTLPNVDAEKLHRLKTRLVAKDISTGINAPPTFVGPQEFYKDLVLHSQTHVFCTHLRNVFIQELLQLNETTFEIEADTLSDQSTKMNYWRVVKSLQLLAKFISFIESMPYKTTSYVGLMGDKINKITLEEVESRSWMTPPIDLHQMLSSAMKKGELILLIPWFVEYLAMLDTTSLRLPYFEPIFEKLFAIFLSGHEFNANYQLIRCCLGWLFEQQHFPSEIYFHFLNLERKQQEKHLQIMCEAKSTLDTSCLIDLTLLHSICPFLTEFKRLLQYNCNRNGSITSKHITPVTAIEKKNTERNEKRIKLQLQEAFLNSKPGSLRKTLEFVSERVASCIVKRICNHIVPEVKLKAMREKNELFADYAKLDTNDGAIKIELKHKLTKIIEVNLLLLQTNGKEVLIKESQSKIKPAVGSLLCLDELQETIQVCAQITSRMCEEKVRQWIDTRVNLSVFKEFDMDIDRIDKLLQKEREKSTKSKFKSLPNQGRRDIEHVDSDDDISYEENNQVKIWNPSKLMTRLQRSCACLLTASDVETKEVEVRLFLQQIKRCHKNRCDLSEVAWQQINQLVLDYLILLCKSTPDLLTNSLLDDFFTLWKDVRNETKENKIKEIFRGVISVRNNVVLMTSPPEDLGKTWKKYSLILQRLLTNKILSPNDFETHCLAVFRENWDSSTLERFCECLQDVVDGIDAKDQFTFLLEFLADYCTDLDF